MYINVCIWAHNLFPTLAGAESEHARGDNGRHGDRGHRLSSPFNYIHSPNCTRKGLYNNTRVDHTIACTARFDFSDHFVVKNAL